MIDHISLGVRDLRASITFYQAALEPLGMRMIVDQATRAGFGSKYPELWLNARAAMALVAADTGSHLCLRARTTSAVDAFYRQAIAGGGWDDGPPGLRQATQVVYYAAFVRDPDGNNVEAVHHTFE